MASPYDTKLATVPTAKVAIPICHWWNLLRIKITHWSERAHPVQGRGMTPPPIDHPLDPPTPLLDSGFLLLGHVQLSALVVAQLHEVLSIKGGGGSSLFYSC